MIENQFYHVYNRGNNKESIFFEDENYFFFLNRFEKYLLDKIDIYSYCLMPNHFHFLIRIKESSDVVRSENLNPLYDHNSQIIKSFKDFFISYSKAINKRYNRTGSLFQRKFKRKLIDNHQYLTSLVAYIHQNPIRAGLCKHENEWKFSSFNSINGNNDTNINKKEVLEWFGGISNFLEFHQLFREYSKIKDFLFD